MIECKNCARSFDGEYCPTCGQKYINKRFTLKESIYWAFHSIFNFDKGFLYTSKAITMRPGVVVKEFLDGITIRYAHPFRFVFIWATISAIIGVASGAFEETGVNMNQAMGMDQEQLESTRMTMEFMKQYMSFVIMVMIPIFSLSSYWLFKSKGLNYAEHLIMMSFAQSGSIIIGLPLTIAYMFFPETGLLSTASIVLGALVICRVFVQTLDVGWFEAIAKYILMFILTVIMFSVLFLILLIPTVLIMKAMGMDNPFKPA